MHTATKDSKQDREQHQPDQKVLTKRQASQKAYQQQHRKQINANRRKRYHKNPTPMREANQRWVAKNRERRRQSQKAWYQKNRERLLTKHREYDRTHWEQANARHRLSYKRKQNAKLRALLDGL